MDSRIRAWRPARHAASPASPASPDEHAAEHVRLGALVRIKTDTASDIALLTHIFFESLGGGFMVDTRDNEIVARGIFFQVGVAGTAGTAEDVHFGRGLCRDVAWRIACAPVIFAS